jgi:hypothetical protein
VGGITCAACCAHTPACAATKRTQTSADAAELLPHGVLLVAPQLRLVQLAAVRPVGRRHVADVGVSLHVGVAQHQLDEHAVCVQVQHILAGGARAKDAHAHLARLLRSTDVPMR